jgi:hypothetical protein
MFGVPRLGMEDALTILEAGAFVVMVVHCFVDAVVFFVFLVVVVRHVAQSLFLILFCTQLREFR